MPKKQGDTDCNHKVYVCASTVRHERDDKIKCFS